MGRKEKGKKIKKGAAARELARTRPRTVRPDTAPESDTREATQRKIAQNRQRRRKKRAAVRFFMLFFFLLVIGVTLSITVFFKIETIDVTGEFTGYTKQEVIEGCGLAEGDNLFRFSTKKLAEEISRKFPLLDNVQVKRVLPSGVEIFAEDAVPTLAVQVGDGYTLLSQSGRIIKKNQPDYPENVYLLKGIAVKDGEIGSVLEFVDKDKMELLERLRGHFDEIGIADVRIIDLTDTVDILIKIGERYWVQLGSDYQLDYKLQMVFKVITEKETSTQPVILDATIPGKITSKSGTLDPVVEDPEPENDPPDGDGDDEGEGDTPQGESGDGDGEADPGGAPEGE